MTAELISLFMGTGVGALTKILGTLISSSVELNKAKIEGNKANQTLADDSADRASKRDGGVWVRRLIVVVCLIGVVIIPFIMAFFEQGVTLNSTKKFLIFEWEVWTTLGGYVILPEVRTTLIAIVGYYFGSSSIKR